MKIKINMIHPEQPKAGLNLFSTQVGFFKNSCQVKHSEYPRQGLSGQEIYFLKTDQIYIKYTGRNENRKSL
jgi:hypothetical protein